MRALSSLPPDEARRLHGVLFDLDDTVLTRGLLTRAAYDALWSLRDAGLILVGVTGRPSGWGELVARQWPVAGCVTENGPVYLVRDGAGVKRHDVCSEGERHTRRMRLSRLVDAMRYAVPEARLTDDCDARRSDVTWDIGERVNMPSARIRAIECEILGSGARATQSSVHMHASFDADDKATGALRFCARELGHDPAVALGRMAFVGDSGNDAACFAAFRTTFGVANARKSIHHFSVPPRYIAAESMGDGFAAIAAEILLKRR